jgi:hypothetical protein
MNRINALELKAEMPPLRRGGKGLVLPTSTSRTKNDGTISGLLKDGNGKAVDAGS